MGIREWVSGQMDLPPKRRASGQWESCGAGLLARCIYLVVDMFKFPKQRQVRKPFECIFFNKPNVCSLKRPGQFILE